MPSKPTKLTDFFEGRRRKVFLERWEHLLNKAGEPRFKLNLRLPLLNESVLGMNGPVSDAFSLMGKDGSTLTRTSLNVKLEGMTIEGFTTCDSKIPEMSTTGATMMKLVMEASGEDGKRALDLLLIAYIPANEKFLSWLYIHLHQEFHLEAIYSQSELNFEEPGDEADEPETEIEEEEEESPAPPRKSGPKDLAAYPSKQAGKGTRVN